MDEFITLKPNFSYLYKKTNYTTSKHLVVNRIYEYDLKAANVSMLKRSGKVNDDTIATLESLPKQAREEVIGKMIKQDRQFYDIISAGIRHCREMLFYCNLIKDDEVLAIKNDAVFMIGRKLKKVEFDNALFRIKNQYSLYYRVNGIEFYYDGKNNRIDAKGIRDEIVEHPDHRKGILHFLSEVFKFIIYDRYTELREYLIDFTRDYKSLSLPIKYYREFNSENIYRTKIGIDNKCSFNMDHASDDYKDMINPTFNYIKFILPIIQEFM